MTNKAPRTKFEKDKEEDKIRFLRRAQQEQEARRSLRDFLRHSKEESEEMDAYNAPTNPLS